MPSSGRNDRLLVLFDNQYRREFDEVEDANDPVDSSTQHTAAELKTIFDWKLDTTLTWTFGAPTTGFQITLDGHGTSYTPNCGVIANHNFNTTDWTQVQAMYWTGSAWMADSASIVTLSDPIPDPLLMDWTPSVTLKTGWGVRFVSNTGTTPADLTIGQLTLGWRCADFSKVGTLPGFDPYGFSIKADGGGSPHGSPIGTKARSVKRRFSLKYSAPGFSNPGFLGTSPSLQDMRDHLMRGLPTWFAWNRNEDRHDVFMARANYFGVPMISTDVDVNGLDLELEALDYVDGIL